MSMYVTTSPLSLARMLWWYGEDELWPRALELAPARVAGLAKEFGRLYLDDAKVERLWPQAPKHAYLLLPVIRLLEGKPRPAARSRRRPEKNMPEVLRADEEARWNDPGFQEVKRLVDKRSHRL